MAPWIPPILQGATGRGIGPVFRGLVSSGLDIVFGGFVFNRQGFAFGVGIGRLSVATPFVSSFS